MKDKHGNEVKVGDTVRAVWRDAVTGIGIAGYTGEVQQDMTVKHITPYTVIHHTLTPITREFEFEVIVEANA